MNFPNLITTTRLFLIPVIIDQIFSSEWFYVIALLILAFLTDVIDGWIARKTKTQTKFGCIYDSAVDKIFMAAIMIALIVKFALPAAYLFMILTRDILVLLIFVGFSGLMLKKKEVVSSNIYGKATTVFQFITFIFIISYFEIGIYLVYVTFFLGLFAAINYFFEYKKRLA